MTVFHSQSYHLRLDAVKRQIMPSPFDTSFQQLVREYAAEDFMQQRKRLRAAREKWIEENECPTSYSVETKSADGETQTFSTPFQIGKIQYPEHWNDTMKEPARYEDPASEAALLDGIDTILNEDNHSNPEKRLTVMIAGGEQHAFFTGGDAEDSPHPPIEEGESYDEYYARVSSAYEREAGSAAVRRPVSGDDGVRESTAINPPGIGRHDAAGDVTGGHAGAMLDSDTKQMLPGEPTELHPADPPCSTPGADHDSTNPTYYY